MSPPISSISEALTKAEAWCNRAHEVATDPDGERLRHLRRRKCVEHENRWKSRKYPKNPHLSKWEAAEDEFCQQAQDVQNQFDRLLPGLRDIEPDVVSGMKRMNKCLGDLETAVWDRKLKGDGSAVCRTWFAKAREQYRQLCDGEADWVQCLRCREPYQDPAEFDSHFHRIHGFPCRSSLFLDGYSLGDEERV